MCKQNKAVVSLVNTFFQLKSVKRYNIKLRLTTVTTS